ncbi:MAG: hypothetical protein IKW28_04120 [Lachnospiraceae bacterium]|nr:hypothetical protein [Lachnospiraceae bacterium]
MTDIKFISTKEAAQILGLSTRKAYATGNTNCLSCAVGNISYMELII